MYCRLVQGLWILLGVILSSESMAQSKAEDHTSNQVVLSPTRSQVVQDPYQDWPYPKSTYVNTIRYQLDLGLRSIYHDQQVTLHDFIGIDSFIPIQTRTRTWGSFIFQWYALRTDTWFFDQEQNHVGQFDHTANLLALNLDLISRGRLTLSLGHLQPYYSLRQTVNTTRTIRQLIDTDTIGLRFDWGMALHGKSHDVSYAFMLSQGHDEFSWNKQSESYLATARIATLTGALPFQIGLSALSGRVVQQADLIPRWRTGIDLQYQGPVGALFEFSVGRDYRTQSVMNALAEIHWYNTNERWKFYSQQKSLTRHQVNTRSVIEERQEEHSVFGCVYHPLPALSLSAESAYLWDADQILTQVQARYFW